ncbi:MAG TPA: 30S ribosomal protein S16 [Amnibacterium sp.]|uniref:30S ribosomal protein S16 n=1 Tax=Amnibacterium sp. TaxID=1872496 RepID=UPI002F94403B
MAVKIRLKRLGKIRAPYYRIVVADSRTKRDGRVIEEIGKYHPTEHPSVIEVDSARAQYWLGVGAQPTEQVAALLKLTGDWGRFKGDANAQNRVEVKGEKVAFQPDAKKNPVVRPKSEVKDAVAAVQADAEADAERVDEAESGTTVVHETPEQADNS